MDKKTYRVTERAGAYVAGVRRPASGFIDLTDAQAKHELRLGSIELAVPEKNKAPAAPRKARRR